MYHEGLIEGQHTNGHQYIDSTFGTSISSEYLCQNAASQTINRANSRERFAAFQENAPIRLSKSESSAIRSSLCIESRQTGANPPAAVGSYKALCINFHSLKLIAPPLILSWSSVNPDTALALPFFALKSCLSGGSWDMHLSNFSFNLVDFVHLYIDPIRLWLMIGTNIEHCDTACSEHLVSRCCERVPVSITRKHPGLHIAGASLSSLCGKLSSIFLMPEASLVGLSQIINLKAASMSSMR
jgi:hypothetical protein